MVVLVVLLGLFGLVTENLENFSTSLLKDLRVVVYLNDGFPKSKIPAVRDQLTALPHVTESNLVDKDVALKRLMKKMNGRFEVNDINRNPLPDSIELRVDDPAFMPLVAKQAYLLPEVQKVKFGEQVAERLMSFTNVVRWMGGGLLAILLLSTVLVMSNTIRLAVFARRREIEIMQMVGASRWYIRIPFLLEGILLSLSGALLASAIVSSVYHTIHGQLIHIVAFLPVLEPTQALTPLVPVLLGIGICVGAFGSYIAVNRYLQV